MKQEFKRYEFKYWITENTALTIRKQLESFGMHYDEHIQDFQNCSYPVTSLYFDSPGLTDYYDKAGGFIDRKKIRIRIYAPHLDDSAQGIWLERKEKHDMLVSKKRILLSRDMYDKTISGSLGILYRESKNDAIAQDIFSGMIKERMRPLNIVRYLRVPMVLPPHGDLRITFDSHIETCFSKDLRHTPLMYRIRPRVIVLEVKFSHILPAWFGIILRKHNLVREQFSKYALSLETLHSHYPIPR